jgi:hypothetical protein
MQPLQRMGQPNVRFRERKPSRLQETLGRPEGPQQIREMAQRLGDASDVGLIRAALFLAGAAVPEAGGSLKAFLNNLRSARWTPIPVCFVGPQAGDVFVTCDASGEPVQCGFVTKTAKVPDDEEPWFMALDGSEQHPYRRPVTTVIFWMRGAG